MIKEVIEYDIQKSWRTKLITKILLSDFITPLIISLLLSFPSRPHLIKARHTFTGQLKSIRFC